MTETVSFTQMTSENGMKRSHQQSGLDEDQGDSFHDVGRSSADEGILDGPNRMQSNNKASTLLNGFDQSYAFLLQDLDSPITEGLWKQDEPNSVSQTFSTSPLQVSNTNERRNGQVRETSPHAGLHSQPETFVDPQRGTWNFSQPAQQENAYPSPVPAQHVVMPVQPILVSQPMTTSTNSQHPDHGNAYDYYPYHNGGYAPGPIIGYVYDPRPPPPHNPFVLPAIQPMNPTFQQQYPPILHPPYLQPGTARASVYQRQNSNDTSLSGCNDRALEDGANQASTTLRSGHEPVLMHISRDEDILSDYQIFLRKQIEFFEADEIEVKTATPGRKKPVVLGQVGMRCIHCADVPIQQRASATAYFPSKLKGLYQAAQNIGTTHFRKSCPNMPPDMQELANTAFKVNGKRATAGHGGKQYWADSAGSLGVVETEDGLRFSTD